MESDGLCAKCHDNPDARTFFECAFCKQSLPVAQVGVLISDQECCNDVGATLHVCDACVATTTVAQLTAKLVEKEIIYASDALAAGDMPEIYFAVKKPKAVKKAKQAHNGQNGQSKASSGTS